MLKELATTLGPILVADIEKRIEKGVKHYLEHPHGSKVKSGKYADCEIEMHGDKAVIEIDPDDGLALYLTSENIESCRFDQKKEKLRQGKLTTYYYYHIVFKDGSTSYVRMRKKYREAMENHGVYIQ